MTPWHIFSLRARLAGIPTFMPAGLLLIIKPKIGVFFVRAAEEFHILCFQHIKAFVQDNGVNAVFFRGKCSIYNHLADKSTDA